MTYKSYLESEARALCERAIPCIPEPAVVEYLTGYLMGAHQVSPEEFYRSHNDHYGMDRLSKCVLTCLYLARHTGTLAERDQFFRYFRIAVNDIREHDAAASTYESIQNHGIQESPTH